MTSSTSHGALAGVARRRLRVLKTVLKNTGAQYHPVQKVARYLKSRRSFTQETAATMPTLDRAIVDTLKRTGICITSLEALGLPETAALSQASQDLMQAMPEQVTAASSHDWDLSRYAINLNVIQLIEQAPAIYLFGLQSRLLQIVEQYIRSPIAYVSADMRRDLPQGGQIGSRSWHRDAEDRRMLKIIIYLNDVEQDHGPFEYIPNHHKIFGLRVRFRGLICDDKMAKVLEPKYWRSCPGKAGTVIFVDTARLFHHGKVPQQERFALFYNYTSQQPRWIEPYQWLTTAPYASLMRQHLSPTQQSYLLQSKS